MTKEEVIQHIKDWNLDNDKMEILSVIIPELKENEDEKIRKELIQYLKDYPNLPTGKYCRNDFFTWLEKQGERTTDKIIERARTEKQRVLLTETNGDAHIDWDCRSLQDVKLLLKYGLEYIDTQIKKQGEQKQNPCEDCNHAMLNCNNFPCEEKKRYNGEQKSADKVEQKFKIGDWCIDNVDNTVFQITKVISNLYYYRTNEGKEYSCITWYSLENDARLWTIQDAKDGDVMMANAPFIFNGNLEDGIGCPGAHCGINTLGKFQISEDPKYWTDHTTTPATKEQRDLLFTKMKEAGYEWDAEKKELKKIERKPTDKAEPKFKVGDVIRLKGGAAEYTIRRVTDTTYYTDGWSQSIERCEEDYELVEQKSAWSEEDEEMFDAIIADIQFTQKAHTHEANQVVYEREIDWLKSIKERAQLQSQSKQELKKIEDEYVDLGLPSGTMWKSFNEDGYYTFDEAVEEFGSKLPTKGQWEELKEVCKWEWKDNGYDVTGPNGNMIFLPAAGYRYGTEVYDVGASGSYWSCTSDDEYSAWDMYFHSGGVDMCSTFHSPEFSVRLVK